MESRTKEGRPRRRWTSPAQSTLDHFSPLIAPESRLKGHYEVAAAEKKGMAIKMLQDQAPPGFNVQPQRLRVVDQSKGLGKDRSLNKKSIRSWGGNRPSAVRSEALKTQNASKVGHLEKKGGKRSST